MQFLCQPNPKDLRNLVDCKFPQSQLTRALEYFVDRKVPTKDKIPTKLDLTDRIVALQVDCLVFAYRKFWGQDDGPVLDTFANHFRGEAIRCCLQGFRV